VANALLFLMHLYVNLFFIPRTRIVQYKTAVVFVQFTSVLANDVLLLA
jgi:hypothetical protein